MRRNYNKAKSKFKAKGLTTLKFLIYRYKAGAKRRKLEFSLTHDEFVNLISQDCTYCGEKPRKYNVYDAKRQPAHVETKERATVYANGIDRVDPSIGYVLQNCVACCYKCNIAKSDMTLTEFKEWILKLTERISLESTYKI